MTQRKLKKSFLIASLSISLLLSLAGCSSTSDLATTTISEKETIEEGITSFEDINTEKVSTVALGNSDVPVGQYSEELLTTLGFWEDVQSKISFATNVKEVLSQVELGSADCGIVYATDAYSSDQVKIVCEADKELIKTPIIYPMAILRSSTNKEATSIFYNFLFTEFSMNSFTEAGFNFYYEGAKEENKEFTEKCSINVFAAASLTESLTSIYEEFKKTYPNIEVVFNFDSSGTLKTQIESGAKADLFISAATKQMVELTDGGFIDNETTVDLLENKVVLIIPKK